MSACTDYTAHSPEASRVCGGCCPGLVLPRVPAARAVSDVPMPRPQFSGRCPVNPEMMGYLLRLQGERMIKMGQVLVKYGQMSGEKHQRVAPH
jgi:hypothetical protein